MEECYICKKEKWDVEVIDDEFELLLCKECSQLLLDIIVFGRAGIDPLNK